MNGESNLYFLLSGFLVFGLVVLERRRCHLSLFFSRCWEGEERGHFYLLNYPITNSLSRIGLDWFGLVWIGLFSTESVPQAR